jgi:hypothetical protein
VTSPEICDGVDNNCNGFADEGLSTDVDGDGHYTAGSCLLPNDDCDDGNPVVFPTQTELCDGLDNDCDLAVDEGLSADLDGDGHFTAGSCLGPADDCDAGNPASFPGNPELCDGLDNNCDGVDEDCDGRVDDGTPCFDNDGDGFSEDAGDCDDGDASVHPGMSEQPDGVDQDCDDSIDEGTLAGDDDGDGFCEGYDIDRDGLAECGDGTLPGDCGDGDPSVNPNATEVFGDGIDNDCDGVVDDPVPDSDQDGWSDDLDCAPLDSSVSPGTTEIANGVDDDCDGAVDEGGPSYDDDGDCV